MPKMSYNEFVIKSIVVLCFLASGDPVSINQGERVERVIKFFSDETLQAEVILNVPPRLTFKSMTHYIEYSTKIILPLSEKQEHQITMVRFVYGPESSQNDYATLPVYVKEFPSLIRSEDIKMAIDE